jgi:hypothetical protein
MVADEDAQLSRSLTDMFDGPRRGPPDIPIVEADIVDVARRGEWRDQREYRHAALQQLVYGMRDERMHRSDDAYGVAGLGSAINRAATFCGVSSSMNSIYTSTSQSVTRSAAAVRALPNIL